MNQKNKITKMKTLFRGDMMQGGRVIQVNQDVQQEMQHMQKIQDNVEILLFRNEGARNSNRILLQLYAKYFGGKDFALWHAEAITRSARHLRAACPDYAKDVNWREKSKRQEAMYIEKFGVKVNAAKSYV